MMFGQGETDVAAFAGETAATGLPAMVTEQAGSFELTVEPDGMAVFLTIRPALGGAANVSLGAIREAMEQAGVVHGVDESALQEAVEAGQCHGLCVARGTPAVPGQPTRFESLLDVLQSRRRAVSDRESVDYRELGNLLVVVPGDALMRRIPAMPGKDGLTVTGTVVPAPVCPDIPFAKGLAGVAPDAGNPDLLCAAVAGVPALKPHGVIVNPVVEVKAVDLETGNIDFDGTLRVSGDIKTGMVVKVRGDVIVMGTVEAATVLAGGNLVVHGGIVGGSTARAAGTEAERLARIECEGSVRALFVNHATVEAGGDVYVEREIFNSDVSAGQSVVVGGTGPQGSIVGGRTRALHRVQAVTLGSMAGVLTEVQVGLDPKAESRRRALEQERLRLEEDREKLEQLIIFLQRNPAKAADGMGQRVSRTHAKTLADLAMVAEKERALNEELKLLEGASIEATRKMWDGVRLRVGRHARTLLEDMPGGRAYLQDDEVVIS